MHPTPPSTGQAARQSAGLRQAAPLVRTRPIDDPEALLALLPNDHPSAWVRHGEGLVGWGVAAELQVRGFERFSRTQRWWNSWCQAATVDDTVAVPGSGPVAFGSFTFDPDAWSSIVIVPKVIVGRRGGQAWMTVVEMPEAEQILHAVNPPSPIDQVQWRTGAATEERWQAAVREAVRRINAGEMDKVVLARDIIGEVTGPLDLRLLLQNLASAYPSCWTFAVDGLVGATPELLVRRTGDLVTSRVLAGTVRRQGDANIDASLAEALLASGKDLEEHEYAVHSVARALAAHCTDLDVPPRPHVLRLANVQHLATDVTGQLADGTSVLALAAALHPTAAVCGTPTERAMAAIRELEGMDRRRYAGPVGWFDAHGDGEFGLALRCAEVDAASGRVRAFAGCGIVSGSNPEQELAESQAKLAPVMTALA
ncbi:MAG: isochorismate synthase MenF [Actinomycetales bacterium]